MLQFSTSSCLAEEAKEIFQNIFVHTAEKSIVGELIKICDSLMIFLVLLRITEIPPKKINCLYAFIINYSRSSTLKGEKVLLLFFLNNSIGDCLKSIKIKDTFNINNKKAKNTDKKVNVELRR